MKECIIEFKNLNKHKYSPSNVFCFYSQVGQSGGGCGADWLVVVLGPLDSDGCLSDASQLRKF